jgi:hypothetical protein
MKFSVAQFAILAVALGVSAAPTHDSTGLAARQVFPRHFSDYHQARKTSDDDDDEDKDSSSSSRLVPKDASFEARN